MTRRGFTLIEIVIAALIMGSALLSFLWMNSYSSKSAMDAYFEFMAVSLAKEPIEVFRGFGYKWLSTYQSHQMSQFPLGETPVSQAAGGNVGLVHHPADAAQFTRNISLTPVSNGTTKAIKVRVRVAPLGQGKILTWLSRNAIVLETLVVEKQK